MKRIIFFLVLTISLPAASDTLIGLFADTYGDRCWADLTPFVEIELHVLVFVDSHDLSGGLTAAEFRLENWPDNSGYPMGMVTEHWNSDLTLGALDEDFSIAFSTPQTGSIVELGTLNVQLFSEDWIGENYAVSVGEGLDCGCIVVVNDLFDLFEAKGLQFTFNCDQPCSCLPGVVQADSNWSQVKALY